MTSSSLKLFWWEQTGHILNASDALGQMEDSQMEESQNKRTENGRESEGKSRIEKVKWKRV